jgi:DNA-binding cell septation regulator SpoVG
MIKVESIKPISNAGNLRAFCNVSISDKVQINDVRIIQQPNARPWVSMPSRAFEKDGVRKWAPMVEILDEDLKGEVETAVLLEYAKLIEAKPKASTSEVW